MELPNLLAFLLLLFVVRKIWEACWILVLRPLMISRRFKKQGISGPKYRILYGNLGEIKKMTGEAELCVLSPNSNHIFPRVFPHYHQWMSQYGKTFLYWNGTTPTIYISDHELGKQILSSKFGFSLRPKKRPEVFILFGKGLPLIEGDDWVRHRRILNPAFSMDRLKAMTGPMVDCTLRMFDDWRKQRNGEGVIKMEMSKEFHRLTADIIATTAFGSSYAEGIELCRSQEELEKYYITSQTKVYIPGMQYIPTPTNLQLWKHDKKVKKSIERIIAARLKSKSKYGDDLMGIMLKAATSPDESDEITMTIDEIIDECKTFYFSGQGTTSILLTWTTMLLSLHRDWQEKLREEVFSECGKDKIPDSDTFSKLKLLNMVLMESLRLYGPVIKMSREATQDMKVGHLEIPKGTSIILPLLKMHSDKAIWGEDAHQFNPLRFKNGVSHATSLPNALLPFSIGPRACIAQNFAMIEAKTVLTMILQRFRLSLSSEYKHTPVDRFNVYPQYGLPVLLQPLDSSF